MVLGFGDKERKDAMSIIVECADVLRREHDTDIGENMIKQIQKKYYEKGEDYKKLPANEAPDRYCYFFVIVNKIYHGKYIAEFTFHHINRRHPFSPDGWAAYIVDWILVISPHEEDAKIYSAISL